MTEKKILEGLTYHSGQALRGCWDYDSETDSFKSHCPYFNVDQCHQALLSDAISLIQSKNDLINHVYLEIKGKWNYLRGTSDPSIGSCLRFLVRLMEMIEAEEDSASEGGEE